MDSRPAWHSTPLRGLLEVLPGFAFDSSNFAADLGRGLPLIRIRDLRVQQTSLRYVGAFDAKFVVRTGDTIVGMDGDFEIARWRGPEALLNQRVCRLRSMAPDQLSDEYIRHRLEPELKRLHGGTGATTVKHLSTKQIEALEIPLPPLPEQRKIAAILTSVDETIEKTEAVIAQLEVVKKAMLEELLTRGIPGRHSRFKMTEIGEVPEEWKVEPLESVADVLDSSRKPLNSTERQTMQGPFPYYGANGPVDRISEWIFDEPLLLMAEDGGYFDEFAARPIAYLVDGKCWVNNHAHVLRVKEPNVREWVFYSLVHRDIRGFINSATRSKLNQADLRRIPIPLPTPAEQAEMARTLSSADAYRTRLLNELEELRNTKSSLSACLLSGEVRVITART